MLEIFAAESECVGERGDDAMPVMTNLIGLRNTDAGRLRRPRAEVAGVTCRFDRLSQIEDME